MLDSVFRRRLAAMLLLVLLLGAGAWLHSSVTPNNAEDTDIYYSYAEGSRLLHGENPYARIQGSDMRANDKYATYFPLFYDLSYLSQLAGLRTYPAWIAFWRVIFLLFDLACAAVIFWTLERRGQLALAVLAALLWLGSRWNLHLTQLGYLDAMPIFCLLLSLLLFDRQRGLSLLLFSTSLALKQIAIFAAPLYLVWVWQEARERRLRQVLVAVVLIASVPLVASLRYLAWDAGSYVRSILFSATRRASSHVDAPALPALLGLDGPVARLPLLAMLALTYLAAWRRQLGRYLAVLLSLIVFTEFNPVLFLQYFAWLVPFLPLAAADFMRAEPAYAGEAAVGYVRAGPEPGAGGATKATRSGDSGGETVKPRETGVPAHGRRP